MVDAGASGQKRLAQHPGGTLGPVDLTGAGLQIENEVDGVPHGGPHPFGEFLVPGDEYVMPYAGGDISTEVAIAIGILDDTPAVLDRPGPVAALLRATPLVGRARLINKAGGRQSHGALDVIPRIGVAGQ